MVCTLGLTCASLLEEYDGLSPDCNWRRVTTAVSITAINRTTTATEMDTAIIALCPDDGFGVALRVVCVESEDDIGVDPDDGLEVALRVVCVESEDDIGIEVGSSKGVVAASLTVEEVLRLGEDDVTDVVDIVDVVDDTGRSHAETELPIVHNINAMEAHMQ